MQAFPFCKINCVHMVCVAKHTACATCNAAMVCYTSYNGQGRSQDTLLRPSSIPHFVLLYVEMRCMALSSCTHMLGPVPKRIAHGRNRLQTDMGMVIMSIPSQPLRTVTGHDADLCRPTAGPAEQVGMCAQDDSSHMMRRHCKGRWSCRPKYSPPQQDTPCIQWNRHHCKSGHLLHDKRPQQPQGSQHRAGAESNLSCQCRGPACIIRIAALKGHL